MADENGYPTSEELRKITTFGRDGNFDFNELMEHVRGIWLFSDYLGFQVHEFEWGSRAYFLSKFGFGGNRLIIDALRSNVVFWHMCFEYECAGGHYCFIVRDDTPVGIGKEQRKRRMMERAFCWERNLERISRWA